MSYEKPAETFRRKMKEEAKSLKRVQQLQFNMKGTLDTVVSLEESRVVAQQQQDAATARKKAQRSRVLMEKLNQHKIQQEKALAEERALRQLVEEKLKILDDHKQQQQQYNKEWLTAEMRARRLAFLDSLEKRS